MLRVLVFLVIVAILAVGAAWLADHPGEVALTWQGWHVETSVTVLAAAIVLLVVALMLIWTLLRLILGGPALMAEHFRGRRRERGLSALSRGMIAAGAGDRRRARQFAGQARKLMRGEPLTLLLEAQAAQLGGDRKAARRAFEAMLKSPETELLGLRGLFIEASRAGESQAARHYAERANHLAPALPWAGTALFEVHTRQGEWDRALAMLSQNADHGLVDKPDARRARAVLLTARALDLEEGDPDGASELALEAHRLAPELVPAAVLAGRLAADAGNTRQATRIIDKTWRLAPHPDLAEVYAHARPGDSARDRLKRVRSLASGRRDEPEGRIAVAVAAIEARDWAAAREALAPLAAERPSRRVCQMMAEIEEGETGDAGRVREWLARALRAPRDPAWVADGFVSDHWAPVSPVTGRLDAFQWIVPPESLAAEPAAQRPDALDEPPPPELVVEPAEAEDAAPPRPEPAAPPAPPEEPAPPRPAAGDGPAREAASPPGPVEELRQEAVEAPAGPPRLPDDPGPEPEPERDDEPAPGRRLL